MTPYKKLVSRVPRFDFYKLFLLYNLPKM